jgi:hypothetical protein
MATFGEFTTEQLCSQCKRLSSNGYIQIEYSEEPTSESLVLSRGSICPFCRFFDSTLHDGKYCAKTKDLSIYLMRRVTVAPGHILQRGFLQLETLRSDFDRPRFLLSLPIHEGEAWEGSGSRRRDLFKRPHSDWLVPYRRLNRESIDFSVLKKWIHGCQRMHLNYCMGASSLVTDSKKELPMFRLIDCRTREIAVTPRNVEYVALSYVWGRQIGGDPPSDHSQLHTDLPTKLPNTIEDAMKVTISLGYRYLWVDKYCIYHHADHNELQAQLATMNIIYSGACVTVIAAAGDDASFGLPGVGSRSRIAHNSITINGSTWVSGYRDTLAPVSLSVWATRGWVSLQSLYCRILLIRRRPIKKITSPGDD